MHSSVSECKGLNTGVFGLLPAQPDTAGVGPRVRQLREERGLSREDLAPRAGISARGLEQLEKEGSNPTLVSLVGVARALGVSLDELVGTDEGAGERLRLIRLLADPGETPDDVTLAMMRYLRRLMAGLGESGPTS